MAAASAGQKPAPDGGLPPSEIADQSRLYNYLDFGTPGVNFTPAVGTATFPINIKQNINSFMVGINYRFGAIGY